MFRGIIAMDDSRIIGKGSELPWPREKGDLSFFKQKTWGQNVLMGRTTFKGLGRTTLPNRRIFVLTHNFQTFGWTREVMNYKDGVGETHIVTSVEELPPEDFWVCGGKQVYELFLPKMSEFFVTYIKGSFEGNVSMPYFENQFRYSRVIAMTDNYRTVWYWN